MNGEELLKTWTEEACRMGQEHGRAGGPTSDDTPLDIIDLQALADATGAGTSWSELADIQAVVTHAYEEGVRSA